MAAGAVEHEHQLRSRPLAERLPRDEILELGHEAGVPPERQVGLDPLLDGGEPGILEPRTRVSGERLGAELCERRPAPELECFGEALRRGLRVAGTEQLAPLSNQALEPIEVELALLNPDGVARWLGDQTIGAERLPQLRDIALERLRRRFRRLIAPEVVDKPGDRDNPVTAQ